MEVPSLLNNISISTPTAPVYSSVAGAVTGVALWALQQYAFSGSVPAPIQGACWVIIPAAVTGIASLLTRRKAAVAVTSSQKTDRPKGRLT